MYITKIEQLSCLDWWFYLRITYHIFVRSIQNKKKSILVFQYATNYQIRYTRIGNKKHGSSRNLRKQAEKKKNAEYSGESVHNEVINLTEAKLRDLELAKKEFSEQARQERMATSNTSTINYYAEDADAMYMSA